MVQGRSFSDKKNDLKVKNIVIYLREKKKEKIKMLFKRSFIPQGIRTYSLPDQRRQFNGLQCP